MARKIYLIIGGVFVLLLGVFIWRLDIPNWKNLVINKLTEVPSATLVYDAAGELAGTLHGGENRTFVPIEVVPDHVQKAFIAAEDLRFYEHSGIDVYRMFGALWQNIRSMSYAQGASTITQQLIKLTHLTSAKSLSRKAQEIRLALQLERQMSKDDILESYLNIVYFGRGAYGISSAASSYFGKNVGDLTIAEGALLAGIIKSPSTYAPHLNLERSISRRNSILQTMFENGFISNTELNAAKSESVSIQTESVSDLEFGWYMDTVLSEASNVLELSAEEILSSGFRIYTGLVPDMQKAIDILFMESENFPDPASDGTPVQASFTAMDTHTGKILAIVGGRSYEVRRGLNRSTQIMRQPGSAFKPVSVYAAAIDAFNFVPTSTLEDTPRTFSGNYTPGNAGGASYGTVTLRQALSKSLNIATVDLADLIGVQSVRSYAQRFGLALSASDSNLSLALGSLTDGISPASLTAAYCSLANGGTRVNAHTIERIEDAGGNVIYQAKQVGSSAVKDSTAYMLTDMLKTAATEGSAKALSTAGIPVAGKTGTVENESGNTRDIWTVAYTPDIAICAWMGFDSPSATHALPSSVGGSGYPARLCASFLKDVSPILSGRDFARPASVKTAMIDSLALELEHAVYLSTEKTPAEYTQQELFHPNNLPDAFSVYWSAPERITDLRIITGTGETPVLAFTALSDTAEYVIYRHTDNGTTEIAALTGSAGTEIRFADTEHDLKYPAQYTVIPRNAYLFKSGVLLAAPESDPARYTPDGLLNKIMGVGADNTTQTPTDYAAITDQSLFG